MSATLCQGLGASEETEDCDVDACVCRFCFASFKIVTSIHGSHDIYEIQNAIIRNLFIMSENFMNGVQFWRHRLYGFGLLEYRATS